MKRASFKIVPRAVFGLVTVGVVPAYLAAGCGGANREMQNPVAATGFAEPKPPPDAEVLGVAVKAFGDGG